MDVQRVKRHEWLPVVRRLRCKPSVKLVALTAATYGNQHGGSIFPGIARLGNVTGLDDRTVRVGLKTLRDLGMLRRVFEGSTVGRRGGMADEHVLTLPDDPSGLPLLPADESDPDREAKRAEAREADAKRKRRRKEQGISDPEQGISSTGTGDLSDRNRGSEIRPPVHRPDHVSAENEDHHSARIERDRAGARPRLETFAEFETRHRKILGCGDGELSDEDAYEIGNDYVISVCGDLDAVESSTLDGMLNSGAHPKAIVNKILADRGESESDYRAAQLFLTSLPDDVRLMFVEAAEIHTERHFPEATHRYRITHAARLARRGIAS